jgi:hypothetical protein
LANLPLFTLESLIDVSNASTAYSKVEILQNTLLEKFCSYFPKRKTNSFSTDRPYISKDVKKLIPEKRRLFKEGKRQQAILLKNKIRKLTRQVAKDYYQGKVNDLFQSEPQQWYKEVT